MTEHRPFTSLGTLSREWLSARLHFRIGNLGQLAHRPLGPLVVWNDDEVAPHSGFGLHPHRDIEIVTWVRSGAITHEDDAGNRARLVVDSVQAMHAGTGIHHAERNDEDAPARMFQIWLQPRARGGTPHWAMGSCSKAQRDGRFVTLASGDPADVRAGALPIDTDARVRIATLREGLSMRVALDSPQAAYFVTDHGRIDIAGARLEPRDGALVTGESEVLINAISDADVVMVELLG
ncbi:pirin-like protein [Pandoraea sp. NE5]|uniref:pirin family protein n=1 Tax=Pandoraea sp. NE5 TaxID=2904129 RepID=UPI0021C32DDF|nr:pirin family protein [Pandoraea sp. NE5]BDD91919.1 pirin-like protein [Pandoraea sp. NE5]